MGNVDVFAMGKVGPVKKAGKPEPLVWNNGRITGMRFTKFFCKSAGRFAVAGHWPC